MLLQVAELAGLESLQYKIEGPRADARSPGEGVLDGADREQDQPYNCRQGYHHQPVGPRVLQPEEVGETYRGHPPEDKHRPEDPWDAFLGRDQAHPPGVGQPLDLVEAFRVELLVGRRAWLELLNVRANVVDNGPPCRSTFFLYQQGCFPLLHEGPLLVDHLRGVGLR